ISDQRTSKLMMFFVVSSSTSWAAAGPPPEAAAIVPRMNVLTFGGAERARCDERFAMLRLLNLAVRARDDDDVAVEILEPELAVRRCGVDVRLQNDLRTELARPADDVVEVVHLEPDEHAVSDRRAVAADEVR